MKIRLFLIIAVLALGCRSLVESAAPSITFERIPPQGIGGPNKTEMIEGSVVGARDGQRIVLFAKSGTWWVQPRFSKPFTEIDADSHWQSSVHLGTEYAALLVEPDYRPPATADVLPTVGGSVVAVARVKGSGDLPSVTKKIEFSGYEWESSDAAVNRAGAETNFDSSNAWTDEQGFLHLRITQQNGVWKSAKVKLTRSLGYGSYTFTVRDISQLDSSAVLSLSTWDEMEAGQNHREMNLEIARPRESAEKNLQYIIQPYYLAVNVAQFSAPLGLQTHLIRWEPGKAEFKTVRGTKIGDQAEVVAEHTFTSGIPASQDERIYIGLYLNDHLKQNLQKESEVVIENFAYLPN